jgi:hypothetical protein
MGKYEVKRIIKPVMEFIKTCPFAEEFHIDFSPMGTQKLLTMAPNGSTLDYVGSNMTSDTNDFVRINRETMRQANFQVWLLRKSNHEIYREEIADFLFNFEQWIEFCQAHGLTPKISDFPYEEVLWADNGVYFAEWDGEQTSLYQVQLHIGYKNEYDEEDY